MATARSVYTQCSSTNGPGCKRCPVRGRPLDPYPGSMGSTPLSIYKAPEREMGGQVCKVVKLAIDTPAKCALQSRSAAPLVQAARNAALKCVNARRPLCNNAARQRCQTSYSYTTRQLLHSRGQTYEQKSMRGNSSSTCITNECDALRAKRSGKPCCKAQTASCLACQAGVSIATYCKLHPDTPGCPADQDLCDVCKVESMNIRRENNAVFAQNEGVDAGLYISAVALGQNAQAKRDAQETEDCPGCDDRRVKLPTETEVLDLARVRPQIL